MVDKIEIELKVESGELKIFLFELRGFGFEATDPAELIKSGDTARITVIKRQDFSTLVGGPHDP